MSFIKAYKLTFSYNGNKKIFDEISFEIHKNRKTALLAPNGAGKTTFAMLLLGFLKPYLGYLSCLEMEVQKDNIKKIRNRTGFLFQDPDSQLFMPTVFDDIALGKKQNNDNDIDVQKATMDLIDYFDLRDLKDLYPGNLSLGQKRIVAIAGIINSCVDAIILDEPSSQLDARSIKKQIDVLKRIEKDMLIISHDIDFVKKLCDDAVIIDKGKLVAEGPVKEVLDDRDMLEKHGLI
ncbi:MAG: ABC transporter ATP-binding protein [Candidatus Coatesbacteria bacterium]|nr:ABC transporter ATP-binding protein [Candidatus Coatesbacteria bacterium]